MFDHLHWLHLLAHIQLKILLLIYQSSPKYLSDFIRCQPQQPHFDRCACLSVLNCQDQISCLYFHWSLSMEPTSAHDWLIASSMGLPASFHCLMTALFSWFLSHCSAVSGGT